MLSADHRDFLAAGGLGILIGDGQLSYRPERVLESYYSYAISKETSLTLDYQLLTNPAPQRRPRPGVDLCGASPLGR